MSGFKGPGIIPGYGVPEFVAPAGAVYVRYDETGGEIDRVYVSNGVASALPALQLADGALNQYLFMDSSGTILVDTGSSLQNGTYVSNYTLNSTSYLSGVATAASLANGGIVRLPFKDPATGANDAFSIELYYTPSAINAGGSILNSGLDVPSANGLNIGVAAGGFPFIVSGNDTPAVSGVAMVVGQLTQLVVTWAHNGSNYALSFYQNGVLVSQTAWPTPYKYPADFDLQFGTDHNSPNTSAPGTYQAAAFYNVALSPAQISAHYAAALTGGVPLWSDVQAFKVPGIGIGNAITSGVNTNIALSNETLAINSFIALETAGEIIGLNFEGAGATITSDGTIGTISVPGISLSGTNITDLVPGVGVKETVVSGIGTIWNTGVLGIVQSGTTQTGIVTITGSVTASSAGELAWYSGSGTAVVGNVNVTYNAGALTVGVAGTTTGVLVLSGATSGAVTITPKVAAGGWTMTLPATAGTSGYVLTTDGSGNLSWTAPGGGSGITYGGNPVTSIVAGINVTMSLSSGALTISSTGSGGGVTALTSGGVTAVGGIAVTGAGASINTSVAPPTIVQSIAGYAASGTLNIILGAAPTVGNLLVLTGSARYAGPDTSLWTVVLTSPQAMSITNYVAYRVVQSGDSATWAFAYGAGYNITEISGSSSLVVTGAALTESVSGNVVSSTVAADTVGTLDIITFCDFATPLSSYLPAGATPLGSWTSTGYVASGSTITATNNGAPYTTGYTGYMAPSVNSGFYARVAHATLGASYSLNVPGNSCTPSIYTASGAISPSDNISVINSSSLTAMTLASGTVDGHQIIIKNLGAGATAVTASIDGTGGASMALAAGQSGRLMWSVTLSTYLKL